MTPNFSKLFTFSLIIAFVASCREDDEPIVNSADLTFGIRHDRELSDYENMAANPVGDMPNFAPVVCFSYSLNGSSEHDYVATGTLIDSMWVLTAGHNFFDTQEQNSPAPTSGIEVLVGNDPNNPDQTLSVSQLVFHPTWLDGQQDLDDANDLCLVKLSNPITNITPAKINYDDNETISADVWYCGFGDYSQLEGQDPYAFSKKHVIENILDRVQSGFSTSVGGSNYTGGLVAFDFDNPTGTINSLGDNVINEDEALLGSGTSDSGALDLEGGTVQGDSGGPLFSKNGNNWEVIGVLSGGAYEPVNNHEDGNYGDISIFTRVANASNWIDAVVQ